MDSIIKTFFSLFFDEPKEHSSINSTNNMGFEVTQTKIKNLEKNEFQKSLRNFPNRDSLEIKVSVDYDNNSQTARLNWNNSIKLSNGDRQTEVDNFLNSVKVIKDMPDGSSVIFTVSLSITTYVDQENRVSIYSFEKYVKFLCGRTFAGLFFLFNELLQDRDYLKFIIMDGKTSRSFYTSTLFFLSQDSKEKINPMEKRDKKKLIEKRNEVANFLNAGRYTFTPPDFTLLQESPNNDFNFLMNKLTLICTLIYICNISSFKTDALPGDPEAEQIEFTLTGYKTIKQKINFKDIKIQEDHEKEKFAAIYGEYFNIYDWIYNEGNFVDKIGLARNILSLHIIDKGLLEQEPGAYDSIKSSHQLYLKENVEKYIEIKNKITELMFDMGQKSSEIIDNFIGTFKKNVTAFISYFITLIISNSIAGGKLTGIFTVEITALSIFFLLVSLFFLYAADNEIQLKKKRFQTNFSRLKDRYKDILDENDLKNILNRGFKIELEIEYIDNLTKKYRNLWRNTIMGLLVLVIVFGVLINFF